MFGLLGFYFFGIEVLDTLNLNSLICLRFFSWVMVFPNLVVILGVLQIMYFSFIHFFERSFVYGL